MRRFSEFLADSMGVPKDTVMDLPRVSICGDKEIFVENHKGLCEYTDTDIRFKMRDGLVHITGSGLRIIIMKYNSMVINGAFIRVEYEKYGRNSRNVEKNL